LVGAPVNAQGHRICDPQGWHSYGTESDYVRQLPGAANDLGMDVMESMVRFAARHEYARTVEDVLARRRRLLFLDARQAAAIAPAVADVLAQETGCDPQLAHFQALAQRYLRLPD